MLTGAVSAELTCITLAGRMPVHHWPSISWPAFRALPPERLIAVLPLGALEAHGPHLPLGTDIVIAEAMARAGSERLSRRGFEVVVLPALPVAPAPFAAAFAGTVDTPPGATIGLISGIAESVTRHGGRATVIANAHHDPAHVDAIRAAVRQAQSDQTGTIVFPDLTRYRWASRLTEEFQSGACHAGRYETSAVLAVAPQLVDMKVMSGLPANPQSLVEAIGRGDRTFTAAGGPDAYFGWPAAATAAEGRDIIERLAVVLEDAVLEVIPDDNATPAVANHPPTSSDDLLTTDVARDWRRHQAMFNSTAGSLAIINPTHLGRPSGFSHGVMTPPGWRTLHVAGQTAADETGAIQQTDFVAQFAAALRKVLEVVRAAGGDHTHVARMTVFVTDLDAYRATRSVLADEWSRQMGRHYPAIALVQVAGLVDRDATVEIQADAALPPNASGDAL
jgi:creatinine amidohydrolase